MEAITTDLEQAPHTPLLESPSLEGTSGRRPLIKIFGSTVFILSLLAVLIINQSHEPLLEKQQNINLTPNFTTETINSVPRGIGEGVSAKSDPTLSQKVSYEWTNAMLSWQRTAFHFQPENNWMNGTCTLFFVTTGIVVST